MRKIQFRGKRLDNGEWVHGLFCKYQYKPGGLFLPVIQIIKEWDNGDYLEYHEVDPKTIGQHIGVDDINWYEGDLVKHEYYGLGKISFRATRFVLDFAKDEYDDMIKELLNFIKDEKFKKLKLVGNIHDNSKLLESFE
jgi:hypothetical protein